VREGTVDGLRSASSPAKTLLCPTVIGRDRELGAIRDALADAQEGRGRALFLLGEAGIGKSRLAREAAVAAEERGMIVLRGRAVQAASPVPYRPLAEALCTAVRSGGPPETPELAPFRTALGRLVPEWRDEHLEHADESVVVLGEAVLRFLRVTAADRGCLLVLEDLHWADPESLMILEYLADNLAAEPVLCVATLRVEDQTPAFHLARQLHSRRACPVFDLSRLDEGEVQRMVTACLDAAEASREVAALASRADGIPFLVEELLAATASAGALVHDGHSWMLSESVDPVLPLTFADSVRRRLRPLGAEARKVVFAAAVIGRRFDWSLLPHITGASTDAVLDALHSAVDGQIIVAEAGAEQFLFRHALTRDAVLAELLPPERVALSARALEAIEATHPDLPGGWCELAAEVAQAAGNRLRAATLLLQVGRDALERGALASAEVALDRARALVAGDDPTAVEVEESLAEVLSLAGKRDRAFDVSASLLSRLDDRPDTAPRRAEAHLRLARVAIAATDWPAAREQLALARTNASAIRDECLTGRIDALSAHAAMGDHHPDEAAALARAALATADRLGLPEVACEALEIVGRCARPRDLDEAERAFARAYAIAEENELTIWKVRALHELGTIDLLRGADVVRLQEARDLAASIGALATTAVLDVQLAAALTARHEPDAELAVARRAAELARRYGLELTFAAARAFEGHAHAYARRRREMDECFADATRHAHGDRGIAVIVRTGTVFLALAEEDRPEALRELREAAALSWQSPGDQSTGPSAGLWALVRVVGEPSRTSALPEAPAWWRPVHFLAHAYCRYAEAVILGRRGRGRDAAQLVAVTDAELEGFEWHRQLGRRLAAEAALADGWGEPVSWLREALAYFEAQGYDRIASACRSLLRKAGVSVPRRREGSGTVPASLRGIGVTAREMEVLALLSEGLSNKEIGARLYLSPRTVERHIANLTAKTGVERRSQLVAFAARTAGSTA
jgi:DNA-binding CsgD family transcriptional regulator/tetratricopeptide (TPR) repeat protein